MAGPPYMQGKHMPPYILVPLSKSPQNLPLTTVVYAFVFSKMLWSSLELNGHFQSDRKIYHAKKLCNFSKTVAPNPLPYLG